METRAMAELEKQSNFEVDESLLERVSLLWCTNRIDEGFNVFREYVKSSVQAAESRARAEADARLLIKCTAEDGDIQIFHLNKPLRVAAGVRIVQIERYSGADGGKDGF